MSNIGLHGCHLPKLGYRVCFLLVIMWWNMVPLTLAYSHFECPTMDHPPSLFHSSTTRRWSKSRVPSFLEQRRLDRTPLLRLTTTLSMSPPKDSSDEPQDGINAITKASWYAVEWFGKAFGDSNAVRRASTTTTTTSTTTTTTTTTYEGPPQSLAETVQRIQLDNDRSYFLSGLVDEAIYDPNCVFRDPFVRFVGRDRFVTNLANLGSFITKYNAKVLEYTQPNPTTIQTKIMVKLELNLPWKPILAWPWGVTYTIDPDTYCIIDHAESWDIEPWEGVKQIFRKPTLKLS